MRNMSHVEVLVVFFNFNWAFVLSAVNITCLHPYHFWRPFIGYFHSDSYLAAIDISSGDEKYIGRSVGFNNKTWFSTRTISRNDVYPTYIANLKAVKTNIEILCVTPKHNGFGWRTIDSNISTIMNDCCLVEGGSGYRDGKRWATYIGRALLRDEYFIGVVTPKWLQFAAPSTLEFFDDMGNKYGQEENFEVLTYDCCVKKYCDLSDNADCCSNIS